MPRKLSPAFLGDLQTGLLAPILERVKLDSTLCLEIRDEYVNIYYRGGNLLRIDGHAGRYTGLFDAGYYGASAKPSNLPPPVIAQPVDVCAWLESFPLLKQAIDLCGKDASEREVQQRIVWENNRSGTARSTDYFICDIEYAMEREHRFDLVAVRWPSTTSQRRQTYGHRLAIGEVKFGDRALKGSSGLHAHIEDIDRYLAVPGHMKTIKAEMTQVFNQKHALGLIDNEKPLGAFSDEPPLLILFLVNHDPDSSTLAELVRTLPPCLHAELRIATACFLGHGLFDTMLPTPTELIKRGLL